MSVKRIPASKSNPGFDAAGNALEFPPVVGLNNAETKINFSPVANSWPAQYSIPGADLPTYAFDGNPGDIDLGIDMPAREASFHLRKQ